jgi:hypothetical protein
MRSRQKLRRSVATRESKNVDAGGVARIFGFRSTYEGTKTKTKIACEGARIHVPAQLRFSSSFDPSSGFRAK